MFSYSSYASDGDIVVNEFQVEPSGSSQWVELYNKGDETVNLNNWLLSDGDNHGITLSSSLGPKQCVSFTSGSFHFNTATSDSVLLKNVDTIIDSYTYTKSPGDHVSFGRSPDGSGAWTTFTSPTQDRLNENGDTCSAPTPTPTPTVTPTPTDLPTPTPTPIKSGPTPTKVPTPTKTSTATPTSALLVKTPTPTSHLQPTQPTASEDAIFSGPPTGVLGIEDSAISPTPTPVKGTDASSNMVTVALCSIGGLLLLTCGILVYLKKRRGEFNQL